CTSTATSVRLRITDARSVTIGREYRELNDFRSLTRACLRLSRACLSLRSLHSRAANFSRERGSPGGIARTASRARSLRPNTSTTRPAARTWNPPSRTSSKDFIGDASASDRRGGKTIGTTPSDGRIHPAVTQSVTSRLPTNRSTNLTSSFRNRLLFARAARGKNGSLLGSRGFGHSTWNNSMYRYPAARRPRPWIKHCQQRFNSGTSLGHK